MNMPLKIKRTFGGARGHFFRKARCTLLFTGRCCIGRPAARCLTEKRYKLCAVVPSSAVLNWLGSQGPSCRS
jgi:hypothetical protein